MTTADCYGFLSGVPGKVPGALNLSGFSLCPGILAIQWQFV